MISSWRGAKRIGAWFGANRAARLASFQIRRFLQSVQWWAGLESILLTPDEIIAYNEYEELVASNSLFVRSIVMKSPQVIQVEFKLTLNLFCPHLSLTVYNCTFLQLPSSLSFDNSCLIALVNYYPSTWRLEDLKFFNQSSTDPCIVTFSNS